METGDGHYDELDVDVEQEEEEYFNWGEISVAPALHYGDSMDSINCLRFDAAEETVWVGSGHGMLVQNVCPTLERYSSIASHEQGIISLKSMGHSVVSLSPAQLCLHYSGCIPSIAYYDEIGDLAAFEFDHRGHRALLGRSGGGITSFDLVSGRPGPTLDTGDHGVVALCGPVGRGAFIMGSINGFISMVDPRGGRRQEGSLLAHSGGFAALDASGDLIATSGYSGRMGRVSLERVVKVFDVRMGMRMLANVPFAPGPTMLRLHPAYSSTLLIGSASGVFTLADASGMSAGELFCVDTAGDALVACDMSPSGECIAFGGAGGYVHLWAMSDTPSASVGGYVPSTPDPPSPSPVMHEDEPLSTVAPYFPPDGGALASDIGPRETMRVGLAPRVIEPALLASAKQSDFVGYISNPRKVKSGKPGASAAAVSELRNRRLRPRADDTLDAEARRAERAERRAEAGGVVLPGRYRRVAIKQQTGIKFEEFDFSYYNRTPFSGLENDLANCYSNALLQILFFTKPVRDLAMKHSPDPEAEFSLLGELSFLFRMLATAGGGVCQASNLLRALRQSKEAAALGLLGGVSGERGSADIEVEAQKDRNLVRRAQRLSRFLLEHLNKEAGTAARAPGRNIIEEVFGVAMRQRTQCLSRPRPDQDKATRAFQVELQYPSSKERPPLPPSYKLAAIAGAGTAAGAAAAAALPTGYIDTSSATTATATVPRPSFACLLESSLHTLNEMRAWFDETVSYQMVRQERVPSALPRVMVVGCGMEEDRGDLAWWQPVPEIAQTNKVTTSTSNTTGIGSSLVGAKIFKPRACKPATSRYSTMQGDGVNEEEENEGDGVRQKTRAWLPLAVSVTSNPETWTVAVEEGSSGEELVQKIGARPYGAVRAVYELTALVAHTVDVDEAEDAGPEYEGHLVAHIKVPGMYYGAQQESPVTSRPASRGPVAEGEAEGEGASKGTSASVAVATGTATKAAEGEVNSSLQEGNPPYNDGITGNVSPAEGNPTTPPRVTSTMTTKGAPAFNWLVFNDFHITPSMAGEVTELYGGQKVPVLLYYTRMDTLEEAAHERPAPPAPVLSHDAFLQLCRAPPIQAHKGRLHSPTFVPLSSSELPKPGVLFALDAEFVAYSPPERVVRRGIEIEARPARLGLGRVSLVRGAGPAAGVPCIDDHIKSVEPVYDHLTRFSGILPGDLDPAQSRHHLTTLRRAYLKLRFMVDAGCVFVGHGLKKDFRMLNIVVPPEQVVDTVDLFHSGRGRRLSLRFLSSYLLGTSIQSGTHDSIEDAVAALKLYDLYRKLVDEGTFESKLGEMYDWGNAHGWDPAAWQVQPHLAQSQAVQAAEAHAMQAAAMQQQMESRQRQQQLVAALVPLQAQQRLAEMQQHQQQQQQHGRSGLGRPPGALHPRQAYNNWSPS